MIGGHLPKRRRAEIWLAVEFSRRILPANDFLGDHPQIEGADRLENFQLFIADGGGIKGSGRLNGYEEAYFSDIAGFKQAQAAAAKDPTKAPNISGITTPDSHTIVFKLDRPVAKTFFVQALSLPLSSPVPADYAKKFDAQNPSGYGTHVVATGPYMIQNNSSGELTGYSAGKEIKLVRNPNWDASKDWRPAYLDSITFKPRSSSTRQSSSRRPNTRSSTR